jgi:hypothetical protein
MTTRLAEIGAWLAGALLVLPFAAAAADIPPASAQITRVSATLNGVFSPRGFFNILVPLGQIQGVRATKLDLKKSLITIDFDPGIPVTKAEMRQVMENAGYKPGPVAMEHIPVSKVSEIGPGWRTVKHPRSKNVLIRWLKMNF